LCRAIDPEEDAAMNEGLASRHCEACRPGTPPIEEGRAVELEAELDPSWARDGVLRLRRELGFRNFRDAFGFVARLALLAESEGHHPDIELGWGRVAVTLSTHAAGGLTDNDFILAAKLDRL
jgi:4a-hydroxytetrahydrobiopterin dehydratase